MDTVSPWRGRDSPAPEGSAFHPGPWLQGGIVRSARWPLRALFRGCINVPPCGYSGSLCGRAPGGKESHPGGLIWDCYESTKFLPACPEHDRVPHRTGRLVPTQQRRESVAVRDRLTGRRANRLSGLARTSRAAPRRPDNGRSLFHLGGSGLCAFFTLEVESNGPNLPLG
jgi:hypothetical protein